MTIREWYLHVRQWLLTCPFFDKDPHVWVGKSGDGESTCLVCGRTMFDPDDEYDIDEIWEEVLAEDKTKGQLNMDNKITVTFLDGEATEITAVGMFYSQGVEIKESVVLTCEHPRVLLPDREYEVDDFLVMLKDMKGKFPYGEGYSWEVAFDNFLTSVKQSIISHADSIHINQDVEEMAYLNKHFALIEYKEDAIPPTSS